MVGDLIFTNFQDIGGVVRTICPFQLVSVTKLAPKGRLRKAQGVSPGNNRSGIEALKGAAVGTVIKEMHYHNNYP